MFLAPEIFLGKAPKILDLHYKIQPSTDHRAKFQAGRPMHLGDLMLGKKNLKNLQQNISPSENYHFRAN